jgi:hypothetical protein
VDFLHHPGVVRAHVPTGAWWAEVLVKALAAPGGFDEEDLIGEVIALGVERADLMETMRKPLLRHAEKSVE